MCILAMLVACKARSERVSPVVDARPPPKVGDLIAPTSLAGSLAVWEGHVYWITAADNDVHEAWPGAAPRSLVPQVATDAWPRDVVVGADGVYWLEVMRGGRDRIYRAPLGSAAEPETIAEHEKWLPPLAMDARMIFVVTTTGIDRIDKGTRRFTRFADRTDRSILAMTSDADFVYWLERGSRSNGVADATVFRLAKTGGEPTVIATARAAAISTRMVVDETDVYWIEQLEYGLTASVLSAPKVGGPVRRLAAAPNAVSLAVSPTAVYWATLWDGKSEIMTASKKGENARVFARSKNALHLRWDDGALTWASFEGILRASAP